MWTGHTKRTVFQVMIVICLSLAVGCATPKDQIQYLGYSSYTGIGGQTNPIMPLGEVQYGVVFSRFLLHYTNKYTITGIYTELQFCWPVIKNTITVNFKLFSRSPEKLVFERTVMVTCKTGGYAPVEICLPQPLPMVCDEYFVTVSYRNEDPLVNMMYFDGVKAPNSCLYRLDGDYLWRDYASDLAWGITLRVEKPVVY